MKMESSSLLLIENRCCLYKLFAVILLILSPLIMLSIDGQLRPPPPTSTTTTKRPTFLPIPSSFVIKRSPTNFPTTFGNLRGRGPAFLLSPSQSLSPISSRFMEIIERFVTASSMAIQSTTTTTTTPKPLPPQIPAKLILPPPSLSLPTTTTEKLPTINTIDSNDRMCKQSDMDICSQRMLMITDQNFHYPITMAEMDQRCRELKPMEKCVRHYSQHCFESNIQQKTFSLIIYGVTKTNRAICRNNRRRRQFIEFGQHCANRLQNQLISFVEDMYTKMFAILKYPIRKLRIPLSCCNYYRFKEQALKMYSEQCQPQQSQQMERLLNGFTKDSFTFICSRYTENSERCNRIIDKFISINNMTTLLPITNNNNNNNNKNAALKLTKLSTESFITTYINMIHSIGS
uniref:Uncharacterized protein LOC113788726 n=1 Tax=Dermatophagoides pteronyssinus TaxID=6956 RepID=A0A6P6XMH4_DERPT|nr:uncharacterized protein LOC113788726 [Dermatophagoides pteronyssinus]